MSATVTLEEIIAFIDERTTENLAEVVAELEYENPGYMDHVLYGDPEVGFRIATGIAGKRVAVEFQEKYGMTVNQAIRSGMVV